MSNDLQIRISGTSKDFRDELDRVKKETQDLEKNLAQSAKISAAAFVGLTAAVGGAVSRFSAFESKFTNVVTLLDDSSFKTKNLTKGIDGLKEGILKLSAESGEGLDTLNQGLFDLISGGIGADDAVQALADSTQLAIAGATDTATAVKAMTAATTAFGAEAGTTKQIAESFFTAQKFGVTTVGQLSNEFNKVGGLAKTLGLSFKETLAASTALTANGAKPTAQAFTEMRAAMSAVILAQSKLKDESPEVQDALSLTNIQIVGLVKALQQTSDAVGGDIVALQRLLGSVEAVSAATSLVGAQSGLYNKILAEMSDESKAAATFQEALAVKQATADQAFKRTKQSLEALVVVIGEKFAPLAIEAADKITAVAKSLASMDAEQLKNVASLIKLGLIITGTIAGLTTMGLAFLKAITFYRQASIAVTAFGVALKGGAVGARLLAGALTGGLTIALGVILSYLPEIIDGFKTLFGSLGKKPEAKSIDEVINKLDELGKKKDEIDAKLESPSVRGADRAQLTAQRADIVKDIRVLQDQRETLDRDIERNLEQAMQAQVRAGGGGGESGSVEVDAEKAKQEKIAQIKAEADERDKERRALLEEERVAEQEAKLEKELEEDAASFDARMMQSAELQAVKDETTANITKKDKAELNKKILDEQKTKELAAKQDVERVINTHNQFLMDRHRYGESYAEINKFLNSSEVQGFKSTSAQLAQLSNSKNETMKGIGKRAAQIQIGISTAEGAIKAYASLAGIPIVGPALGAGAAALLIAYGAERMSEVERLQRGGIVPDSLGGQRDRIPALLEPGELVVPAPVVPDFLSSVGRLGGAESEGGGVNGQIIIGFTDDAFEIIEQKLNERNTIGVGA